MPSRSEPGRSGPDHPARAADSPGEVAPIQCAVITVSDRASAGVYSDLSGEFAEVNLTAAGYLVGRTVVPDEPEQVSSAICQAVAAGARVVLTTGGTGLGPRDRTPETVAGLCTQLVPGVVEEIRRRSVPTVPTAMLSRSVAGVIELTGFPRAFVLTMPGSKGGVKDSLEVLLEVLEHVVSQLDGGDHPSPVGSGDAIPRPGPVPRPTA